jgi:protease IV
MRERLAHVPFRGTIRERSVEPYVRLFATLRERRRIRGVLLDISSGGGESIASTDLFLAVKRLNQEKPVYASIGALGASGAYLAALGARRIFAYPESQVGSIGVVMPHLSVQDLLRRIGVSVELLHEGVHKDAYQGLRPLTDLERAKLQAIVHEGYEEFVARVALERHRPVDEIRTLATGETWTGRRALALGLIDALGDREAALGALAEATGVAVDRTIRVGPPRGLVERFLSGPSTTVGGGLFGRLHDTVEDALVETAYATLRR